MKGRPVAGAVIAGWSSGGCGGRGGVAVHGTEVKGGHGEAGEEKTSR